MYHYLACFSFLLCLNVASPPPPPSHDVLIHTQEPTQSAIRKSTKFGRFKCMTLMPRTVAYGMVNTYVANTIWELLVLGYDVFVEHHPKYRLGPPPAAIELHNENDETIGQAAHEQDLPIKPVAIRARNIFILNTTAYGASIAFMSVGSFIWPGIGTMLGGALADLAPLLIPID